MRVKRRVPILQCIVVCNMLMSNVERVFGAQLLRLPMTSVNPESFLNILVGKRLSRRQRFSGLIAMLGGVVFDAFLFL